MHSLYIQFFNFNDSYNNFGVIDKCDIFRGYRTSIPLSSLKVINLYSIACGFYGSLNGQNWMCELYMYIFPNLVTNIEVKRLYICGLDCHCIKL